MNQNNLNRLNLKDRKFGKPLCRYESNSLLTSTFQTPSNWDFIVLQSKSYTTWSRKCYFYKGPYYISMVLPAYLYNMTYDSQLSMFSFSHWHVSYCYYSYLKTIINLFDRFSLPFFKKIRFKGKGYYMYKGRRNTIAPQFGYAHRVYVYGFMASVKFLSKTKILVFGLSSNDVFHISNSVKNVKPINIFTGRGVRFSRQIVYRKKGKVSTYR